MSIKPSWKWESKEEYTVYDYSIANQSAGQKAGWKWVFQRPKNGSKGWDVVWLEDVALAGRSSVSLKSEFLIQVTKDETKTTDGKESVSGTATGSAQKQVMISVDPVTDTKPMKGSYLP